MRGTRVIAEAGVNHDGDLDRAFALVDAAAAAGADIVKFQSFDADKLATAAAAKAPYQKERSGGGEGQQEMLRRLQLSAQAQGELAEHCVRRGIEFLSSPFDEGSLDLLVGRIGVRCLKLGSGEVTNGPLLLRAARTGLPVILSTGMATLGEVEAALGVLAFGYLEAAEARPDPRAFASAWADPEGRRRVCAAVTLLHCTTAYPTPPEDVNLRAMDTLGAAFGTAVGYSDHTLGIAVSIAAAARGATVIEKHFTLDRTLPGPDHAASAEPDELAALVEAVRTVGRALGDGRKGPAPAELANLSAARKSLFAARPIAAGEALTPDAIAVKRPGAGLSPMLYWDRVGVPATRAYDPDDLLE